MSWIKWYHFGVPDEEGSKRERAREDMEYLGHCKVCTALSGCYFVYGNHPQHPQHPYCDCRLLPIAVSKSDLTAYCDIRKLTEYLFRLDNSKGKTPLFEKWGYTIGDSANLKAELERQAREKYLRGAYVLQRLDEYGQRITITITVHDQNNKPIKIKSGWMIRPLGRITCATAFTGVAK